MHDARHRQQAWARTVGVKEVRGKAHGRRAVGVVTWELEHGAKDAKLKGRVKWTAAAR